MHQNKIHKRNFFLRSNFASLWHNIDNEKSKFFHISFQLVTSNFNQPFQLFLFVQFPFNSLNEIMIYESNKRKMLRTTSRKIIHSKHVFQFLLVRSGVATFFGFDFCIFRFHNFCCTLLPQRNLKFELLFHIWICCKLHVRKSKLFYLAKSVLR